MDELLKKQQSILLTIKRMGINGEGIGYYKRKAVFVPGAIPPEEVIVRITEVNEKYATGEIVKFNIKAAKRVKPFCKHFNVCGGCQLQHVDYEEQLLFKQEMLQEAFERYSNLDLKTIQFNDMEGMNRPTHYRHKSQMPVQNTKSGITTGLYKIGSNDLVPIQDCPVQSEHINIVNQKVVEICDEHQIFAFDPKTMQGMLRYIVTRESHKTGEIQVTLIITIFNKALHEVAKAIMEIPNVVSVGISKNHDSKNIEIFGEEVEILAGKPYITEGIGSIEYDLKPKAFYQLNPSQAMSLYAYVKTLLDFDKDQTIIDAYSGAGAISLYLAPFTKKVIGIDSSKESIYSAIHNKKKNKFNNVDFEEGEVKDVLPKLFDKGLKPAVIIFDPPRSGLDPKTLDILMRNPIPKLVYVSCNPSTLAKNIKVLSRKYKVVSVTPFDMFPHTSHVESVTLLTLK